MRLGLIVRADQRGLGQQTWEIYRHLQPVVTVCVDISPIDVRGVWPQHFDRFPDAIISPWSGYLNPLTTEAVAALLSCDVIFTVETTYDPRLFEMAAAKGVKTVIYVNPELHRPHETDHATEVWAPTRWRLDHLPERTKVVPMPVAVDRFDTETGDGWLFVGGHQARADRDGMMLAIRAARGAGIRLTVTSQDRLRASPHFELRPSPENYWELYEDMGFLILPRRYGGLSLKAQEALAAGLVVVMPDVVPNREWPIVPVRASNGQSITLPAGRVQIAHPDMNHLVEVLRELQRNEELVVRQREASRRWAKDHSWDELLPVWSDLLAR